MTKQPLFLEQLPDEFGPKGHGFRQRTEYFENVKDFVHRHASEAGLCLAIISFTMAVL